MSTLDANRHCILYSPSAYLHNQHQASSARSLSSTETAKVEPLQGGVAAKVRGMAAYSVLIVQVLLLLLLLRALLQASVTRCCKRALLAAAWCCCCKRAYHRREVSDLRSYEALVITVEPCLGRCCGAETALLAWWLWKHEDYRMPSRLGRREFGTRALSHFFISFIVLLGRGR